MTPDLAAFASEESSGAAENAVSLTQVAAHGTSISWVEALACIQQICHAVITGEKVSLDESSIYLHQSGRVSLEASGETSPEDAIQFLGNLLGTWLEGTPHPTALDTILRAAVASPPGYSSVAEFAAALKPYARPDRAQLVRAVYHRAGGTTSSVLSSAPAPSPAADHILADSPAAAVEEATPPAVVAFRRSGFRTPYIFPDAVPTSALVLHQSQADGEQTALPVPARRSLKDIAQDINQDVRRRVVAAFEALAERLRPVLGALLAFFRAIPNRLRPLAKPVAVFAVAAVAIAAVGISGYLLVTTFMRPSQPMRSAMSTSTPQAPLAKMADARAVAQPSSSPAPKSPAAPAKPVEARPVPASNNVAGSKPPVITAPPAATSASTSVASIPERAAAAVGRAVDAILPPPTPRRTTSIVLEPDRARRRGAQPSSARAAATLPPASPSAASAPTSAADSSPTIDLQAAAPPLPEIAPSAEVVAPAAAVAPKYSPAPPPAAIYSSADAGVIPPVQTYPRYVESIGPDHPNASPFQVVIDENGVVESAALARYPTNMRQAVSGTMLLAAAKAWRFQPATKDGYPVKYRRIIWFSNQ